jgi:hypothetical protein
MSFRVVFRATKALPDLSMELGDVLVWDTNFARPFRVVHAIEPDMGVVGMAEANGHLEMVSHQSRGRALRLVRAPRLPLPLRLRSRHPSHSAG